eukprot:scaffold2495_cov116-Skeletonema_dohrnii-CCMP3373.AAC.3
MKVNTCEYDGKSEYSVSYVKRFGQRKQSSEASSLKVDEFVRADNCKSSVKVDEFGRASNDEDSLKVDEFGRARSEDSLKAEKFSRVGNKKMAWKSRSSAGLVVVVISLYSVRQQAAWSKR